jgi:hypothetical protein
MIVGQMVSPCGVGMDHSLGRDAEDAPAHCKGLTGWPLGCRVVSLTLFSRTEGCAWALFRPYCGLFDFEETIWWVRASAPAGCSP